MKRLLKLSCFTDAKNNCLTENIIEIMTSLRVDKNALSPSMRLLFILLYRTKCDMYNLKFNIVV